LLWVSKLPSNHPATVIILNYKWRQINALSFYGCFESCQFRPRSVFFVSWRLNKSAGDFRQYHETKTICLYIFLISDIYWGTEHQYLFSGFLGVSISQLLIIYRIYGYDMLTRLFRVLTSEQISRRLPVFTLLLWQRQHIIAVDAVDYK
jgi:hypothetical protein